jgi:hypothetical protein
MKTTPDWTTYRTRFLVKAKQLQYSLSFTDALGRHHAGRKGDYLVESSDGLLRIHPRQIFEDVYVPLSDGSAGREFVKESVGTGASPACPELGRRVQPSAARRPAAHPEWKTGASAPRKGPYQVLPSTAPNARGRTAGFSS